MSIVLALLAQLLHIVLVLAAAPTVAGAIDRLSAALAGRAGPRFAMPWRDLSRLWRKTPVLLESVSPVARFGPAVALATTAVAASLVPSFALGMTLSPLDDVIVVVSLLAVARVAVALAVLDAGEAVPGLGQQNASAFAVVAEPALMLAIVALGLMAGSFNLDLIAALQKGGGLLPTTASALAFAAMLILLLADPADSRANSVFAGSDLAMVLLAGWLRRLVWIGLIGALFLPAGIGNAAGNPLTWGIGLIAWLLKLTLAVLVFAGVRVLGGRLSRRVAPELVTLAGCLAAIALVVAMTGAGAP